MGDDPLLYPLEGFSVLHMPLSSRSKGSFGIIPSKSFVRNSLPTRSDTLLYIHESFNLRWVTRWIGSLYGLSIFQLIYHAWRNVPKWFLVGIRLASHSCWWNGVRDKYRKRSCNSCGDFFRKNVIIGVFDSAHRSN